MILTDFYRVNIKISQNIIEKFEFLNKYQKYLELKRIIYKNYSTQYILWSSIIKYVLYRRTCRDVGKAA